MIIKLKWGIYAPVKCDVKARIIDNRVLLSAFRGYDVKYRSEHLEAECQVP